MISRVVLNDYTAFFFFTTRNFSPAVVIEYNTNTKWGLKYE